MRIKVNHFTDELKLKVVQEYVTTDITNEALRKKYGIRGSSCISNWVRKFGFKIPDEQEIKLQRIMKEESKKSEHELKLEEKIRELEKSLDYERLKSLALNTMIDIAERDLKISIRKKHGTKQ